MARIRTIKPQFWTNDRLSALPEATHMLAGALLNYADDEGYFHANEGLIKGELFPLREPSVSLHDSLTALSNIDYIRFGKGADGRRYGRIVAFGEHQTINRPTPSKIKQLEIVWESSVKTHGVLSETSLPEGNKEGKGIRKGDVCAPPSADAPAASPVVIKIPMTGKRQHDVTQADVDRLRELHPAIDPMASLRRMVAWLEADPSRQSATAKGARKRIASWLGGDQDKASHGPRVGPAPPLKPLQGISPERPDEPPEVAARKQREGMRRLFG